MRRKALISFFMFFSFIVIGFGGYHCSLRAQNPQGYPPGGYGPGPGNYGPRGDDRGPRDDWGPEDSDDPDDPLPEKPDKGCNRRQYRGLVDRFGASAFVRFNGSAITDYRFGRESNFGLQCKRMYLNMDRVSGRQYYGGSLAISYEDGGSVLWKQFRSGAGDENKHNLWRGRKWRGDRIDQVFHAIFEGGERAIILKIDEVEEADVRDGETELRGYGEIWYKMFRDFKGKDVCYRKGVYMRNSRTGASKPGVVCWLLDMGPFSCKPQGVNTRKEISLTGNYPCYGKLGEFGNLNINEAFNVDRDEDHP